MRRVRVIIYTQEVTSNMCVPILYPRPFCGNVGLYSPSVWISKYNQGQLPKHSEFPSQELNHFSCRWRQTFPLSMYYIWLETLTYAVIRQAEITGLFFLKGLPMHNSVLCIILNKQRRKVLRDCSSPAVKAGFHLYGFSHIEFGFKTTIGDSSVV